MPKTKKQLLDYFIELAKIPSPSRNERKVADKIKEYVTNLGYKCLEDDAGKILGGNTGNLLIHVPANGKGSKLVLSAHIDTVERLGQEPAKPVMLDNNIFREQGDGIVGADDKSGVAVILCLLDKIKDSKIKHGELLIIFSVCEEVECLGADVIESDKYLDFDAGIVLDHSLPWEIITSAPTKVAIKMRLNGIGGHAAYPDNKINAAHALASTVSKLPSGRLDEYTTANIGILHSGQAINIIPDSGYAEYEIRGHNKNLLDYHVKRTLSIIEGVVREYSVFIYKTPTGLGDNLDTVNTLKYATIDVDVEVSYEGYYLGESSYPVQLLKKSITSCGLDPKPIVAQGGSDANIFNKKGLPSVVIGCGMHGAHSVNERANLAEMQHTLDILLAAISSDA